MLSNLSMVLYKHKAFYLIIYKKPGLHLIPYSVYKVNVFNQVPYKHNNRAYCYFIISIWLWVSVHIFVQYVDADNGTEYEVEYIYDIDYREDIDYSYDIDYREDIDYSNDIDYSTDIITHTTKEVSDTMDNKNNDQNIIKEIDQAIEHTKERITFAYKEYKQSNKLFTIEIIPSTNEKIDVKD